MAKALNVGHREALFDLARRLVVQTQNSRTRDTKYRACAKMVSSIVAKAYPPKDMEILAKYKRAERDKCVHVSEGSGHVAQFAFRDGDELMPLCPSARYCNQRAPHFLTDAQAATWREFNSADDAFKSAVAQRVADLKTLIYSARTFEELVEIWPAADALRERILGTSRALSVMSEDVVFRIRADASARATLAE